MNTINIMHVYFLAIGGAGIGPLAQLAHEAGYTVSGSDQLETSYIIYLREHGITDIDVGDSVDLIRNAHEKNPIDWLVYSSAVEIDEKGSRQLEKAKSLGIKCTKRDLFILELINKTNLKMIAIAGTHGKTTTTAMVSWLFINLNKPISYLIPAKVSFGEMAHYDKDSEYFIYEADEYDRNFLAFKPHLSIISGVSWDHHEIYKTREEYNAINSELNVLDENQISGSSTSYAYQSFGNFNLMPGLLTYSTTWTSVGSYSLASSNDSIRSVEPSGQNKRDYQTFQASTVNKIASVKYLPESIYFAITNSSNQTSYYDFSNNALKPANINSSTFNTSYPSYYLSPSNEQSLLINPKNNLIYTANCLSTCRWIDVIIYKLITTPANKIEVVWRRIELGDVIV